MKGLKRFLMIEDKNYNKARKEETRHNLKIEEYKTDSLI